MKFKMYPPVGNKHVTRDYLREAEHAMWCMDNKEGLYYMVAIGIATEGSGEVALPPKYNVKGHRRIIIHDMKDYKWPAIWH